MANEDTLKRAAAANEEMALLEQAKREQQAFVASIRTEVPSGGGTANLTLSNPSESGVQAHVLDMTVRSQFEGIVDIYDEFSAAPSGGTQGIIDNLFMDSAGGPADVGNMIVRQDATYTETSTHALDVLPSGGPGGSLGGESTATEPIIQPDRDVAIEVANQSGTADDASITVVYTEEPVGFVPE